MSAPQWVNDLTTPELVALGALKDQLDEVTAFIAELRPMLEQLRALEAQWTELQPFVARIKPMLAEAGGRSGAGALVAFLLGKPA
jgi:hypothetical protein